MYDYRGIDGTGTRANPASGSNAVSYTIRKLADGNCWMSENLKLTLSTSHSYEVSTNSGGTTTWTPTSCSTDGACAMNGNTVCTGSGSSRKCWYSWYAATAGSGTASQTSGEAPNSICPKGWRLPSNNENNYNKSFAVLTKAYLGIDSAETSGSYHVKLEGLPLNFARLGQYVSGSQINVNDGNYWNSVAFSAEKAGRLSYSYGSNGIWPNDSLKKFQGPVMRCVSI